MDDEVKKRKRPKVLVVNDDGLSEGYQRGIQQLAVAIERELDAHVAVVAPFEFQAHPSFSITSFEDCTACKREDWGNNIKVYAVLRTPVDCIKFAFGHLFSLLNWDGPDLVVSGVNYGANIGTDLLYSGTIAAAFNARFEAMRDGNKYSPPPAIAVSLCQPDLSSNISLEDCKLWKFNDAIRVTICLAKLLLESNSQPREVIWNVNVPQRVKTSEDGTIFCAVTKPGQLTPTEAIVTNVRQTKKGQIQFRIGTRHERKSKPGTDCTAIQKGLVSLTPLKLTPTLYCPFDISEGLSSRLEKISELKVVESHCYDPKASSSWHDVRKTSVWGNILVLTLSYILGVATNFIYSKRKIVCQRLRRFQFQVIPELMTKTDKLI